MRCGLVCLLASLLSVCVFAFMLPMHTRKHDKLRVLMSKEQNNILDEIVGNRARLSFEGLLIGLLAALPLILLFRARCTGAVVLFVTQAVYYHMAPKKKWMLNYLDTKEQVDQWLIVYKNMKHTGVMTSLSVTIVYLFIFLFFRIS
jgi:uncharacterized membrane protein